jgi:hypothetical protein
MSSHPDDKSLPPTPDSQWTRRKVLTTGLVLLWSMPVITTIALADEGKGGKAGKSQSCAPGGKKLGKKPGGKHC